MIKELGVFPHNMSACSPAIDGDLVFVVTGNGVDEGHKVIPAPDAPSFIAVDKHSGKVAWQRNNPSNKLLHGQWSNPAIGILGGKKQVVFPGGDGQLYAFAPATGDLLWTFQCNPPGSVWKLGGQGTRNNIIATPVIYDNKVFVSLGQDPEHGEGPSHMVAVDGTRQGDISHDGEVWHNGEVQRALSTVAIHEGILYHCDISGTFRAVDAATGKTLWLHDLKSAVWGSPYVVDGKVYIGNEDGVVTVFKQGRSKGVALRSEHGQFGVHDGCGSQRRVVRLQPRPPVCDPGGRHCDPRKVN